MENKIEVLHKLCHALCEELEGYGKKIEKEDGMSAGDLAAVDTLAHALKSIKTVIAMIESEGDGYSERGMSYYMPRMSYAEGRSENYSGRGENYSNARGRNARRDSMGRYSRSGGYSYADGMEELLTEMRDMLPGLSDEKRRKAEQLMEELRR